MPEICKHYMRPKGRGIKLHIGCGDYWLDGFLNIDIGVFGGTDMIWDINKQLPFQPEVVERIELYDVLEHFTSDEADRLLEEFKRLLIEDGTVRLSVPDIDKLIEQYMEEKDKEKVLNYIYGINRWDIHRVGYRQESLGALFQKHGFREINVKKGFLEERPGEYKLILEAKK